MSTDSQIDDDLIQSLEDGDDAAIDAALNQFAGTPADAATGAESAAKGSGDDPAASDGDGAGGGDQRKAESTQQSVDAAAGAKASGQGSQPDKQTNEAAGEDPAAGIATKSGAGKPLPYSLLSGARQRAAAAEARAEELSKELENAKRQLEASVAATEGTGTQAEASATERMQEAIAAGTELAADDFADLPEALQLFYRQHQALQERVDAIESTHKAQTATAQASEAEETQALIDGFDDLRSWQADNGFMWRAALEADKQLLADEAWSDKSDDERFQEVVNRVRQGAGLPPRDWSASNTEAGGRAGAGGRKSAPQPAGSPVPTSISSIPGGGAPNLDMADSVERSSPQALAARMDSMSDDAIDALLAQVS